MYYYTKKWGEKYNEVRVIMIITEVEKVVVFQI
uniref:Uncharacterized protein n=1 Tax=Lepeophtheirus salmonis TaxID=72036 RepID=A0A0K2TFI7_LEPSM